MSKTEGPWIIVPEDDDADGEEFGFWIVRDVPDNSATHWELPTRSQAEAKRDELNKLEAIRAAAPELLEACKYALDRQSHLGGRLYTMLKEAIAKAEQS